MVEMSRRRALISGGALGALGALVAASPAQARSLIGWNWSPSGSVAGYGAGADPHWVWDAEADRLLASLYERGLIPQVNDLLWNWERNDQPLPDGLPADLRDFMEQARQLPSWADPEKLALAEEFNKSRGLYLNLCNGPGGGILATAIPREAQSVYYSAGGADMEDRVAKTSLFGFAVGALNAYRPEGTCVVECVKTRLVHAAVRHLLPQSPHWQEATEEKEIPISQEDMLVTWHTLPTFAMRKMREWEVPMTDDEAEAYLHVWQVTAHVLGIADEYIPATWDAAFAQSDEVLARNMGPTPEGVKLTDVLLGQLAEQTSPAGISRPLCNALARYLVGEQVAEWDGIQQEPVWDKVIPEVWPLLVKFREGLVPLPAVPEVAWTIDEALRQYILLYLTKGQETKIVIPTHNRPE
ncbi:oxygenase MpaB family protein [Saccharopolyspora sp. TS4A08]|uniref:Oxygenase MpaB family protein n=1 Tax=Saccharopolyspora ipomoeae TaxID=3042027 RepID=A0ABT6PHK7_9PSEU|nr:oxygenase MpaB family protein [Saccharopolyspora sp. TS4A08]MDI2027481.1 oxygenase MpaB family protein [Saccharopolyspora sp. TS4A08]